MKTNNADVPTLEVQAYAYVPQVVEVTPMQITIPGSTLATKRQVYVKHHDKTPLKITDLGCTNSAVTCTLNEQVQGQTFQIVVDVPAGYTPQPGGDRVTFKTDSPTMPTVTIPIMQMGVSATASRMPAMAGAARPQPAGAAPGAPAGSAAVGTGAPVKPAAEPTKPPASGTNP
jgi:hypothetical protein